MKLNFISKIEITNRNEKIKIDLLDPAMGAFLGAFMSEGNLTDTLSVKISCKDLNFINSATESINKVFGDIGSTRREPTKEDKAGLKGYHKYYSKFVAKCLTDGYGISPGKKILSNKGLPGFVMNDKNDKKTTDWFKNYLQMRFSGDGHVRNSKNEGKNHYIVTRRVVLSRSMRLKIDKDLEEEIIRNYENRKTVREYPESIIKKLKQEMRNRRNFPKEFLDIQILLLKLFDITSIIYPSDIRCIYFDKKRNIYIVSAKYRIVISKKDDIIKFHKKINFSPIDISNRGKLINLIKSYKMTSGENSGVCL